MEISSLTNVSSSLEEKVTFPQTKIILDIKRNFLTKLIQPSILPYLKDYIRWQAELRQSRGEEKFYSKIPDNSPISINLDPTSSCNFGCPHCVDMDILNTGVQYHYEKLKSSLDIMSKKGLKSVIIIGGGEPTLYKGFEDLVNFLKEKEMQVAVVTNGTGMEKILHVGHAFKEQDWIRLSLDSESEGKFRAMHLPKGKMVELPSYNKVPITLDQICENVEYVKSELPNLKIGFSYIVTWPGARTNNLDIESNVNEIVSAGQRAKDYKFNYIALKAFLDREKEGSHGEIIGIDKSSDQYKELVEKIRYNIEEVKKLEDDSFKVHVATNLRALLEGVDDHYKHQPVNCHMTNFRQVLGIRGISICPGYRDVDKEKEAKISEMYGYASEKGYAATKISTAERIRGFDASQKCKNVVCMYMDANWYIENLIQEELSNPGTINRIQPGLELNDYFM